MERQNHIQITIGELVTITVPIELTKMVQIVGKAPVRIQGQGEVEPTRQNKPYAPSDKRRERVAAILEETRQALIANNGDIQTTASALGLTLYAMKSRLDHHPELRKLVKYRPKGGDWRKKVKPENPPASAEAQDVQKVIEPAGTRRGPGRPARKEYSPDEIRICLAKHHGNLLYVASELHISTKVIHKLAATDKKLQEMLDYYRTKRQESKAAGGTDDEG